MKVIVTGANGFVGSHILEALHNQKGIELIAACRDANKLPGFFTGDILTGDLRDADYMHHLAQKADIVCHTAAWTAAWGHEQQSESLFLTPTIKFIDACVRARVGRFIFLSSTSVAAPHGGADPMSEPDLNQLRVWPHLRNVARIENHMRIQSSNSTEMTNLRVGLFAGKRYSIGLLPMLVPRLKTHLVPWVKGGKTGMPITGGEDVGKAFLCAVTATELNGFQSFNIVGPTVPTVREVINFLSEEYDLPRPHFSVPFPIAYLFARTMELLDPVLPGDPLVTRSIIHLLEETSATNAHAREHLGYQPQIHWKDAIRTQMAEMKVRQKSPMRMTKPTT